MNPPARVTLLSRPGCHLCEAAHAVVDEVATSMAVAWEERDISASAADTLAYGEKIPVVLVDGVEIGFGRIDADRLRAALRA